jgi:D-alanyl-D-alanine carboxypeptidase (penicillin-binding protein 5/6)
MAALFVITAFSQICFAESDTAEYSHEECTLLFEVSSGAVLDSVNADKTVPIGVMNKLMTVLLAAEQIESGKLAMDTAVKTSAAANSMQGAQIWLMPGEEMTLEDLLKGIIIGNANDASVAVAEAVAETEEKFVVMMNSKAAELGMANTSFTNCCGYYDDDKQLSTASDMAKLVSALMKYTFLREYFTCRLDYLREGETQLVSTNKLLGRVDGMAGFKAGRTDHAGYCIAAAAERDGKAFGVIILGCDDEDDMFSRAKALLESAFSEYTVITPSLPENIPEEIAVKGGTADTAALEYGNVRGVVLPKWDVDSLSSEIFLPEYVYAPVNAGDKIGEIHFYRNKKFIFSVDITSADDIEQLDIKKAMVILLKIMLSF